MDPLWTWVSGNPEAQDAAIQGVSTIVAAVLATLTGVISYWLTVRRERRKEQYQQKEERDRAERERADERKRVEEGRLERVNDMVRALHAEILSAVVLSEDQLKPEEISYILKDLSPYGSPDDSDFVFDSVKNDLSILPSSVIHVVVAYYRTALQTNMMIRDMRGDAYRMLTQPEKEKYNIGYVEMIWLLRERGKSALDALEHYDSTKVMNLASVATAVRGNTSRALTEARDAVKAALHEHNVSDEGTDRTAHDQAPSSAIIIATG